MKLAEALLLRKELEAKVKQVLDALKTKSLIETKVVRKAVMDGIDDVTASVNKLTASQVTAEYDYYSRQLREVDAAIQQANWVTEMPSLTDKHTRPYAEAVAAK